MNFKQHTILCSFLFFFFFNADIVAQQNKGKIALEIVKGKIGLYGTTYRARKSGNAQFGDGVGFSSLIYFPFQWSVDYASRFSDTNTYKGEFNQRLFILKPTAIISINDKGSYAFGVGLQFDFLIFKNWYIEYLGGINWIEASKNSNDGLDSGFNLLQGFYISKPLNNHFTFSIGFNHLSDAHIFNTETSNDQLLIGLKYIF